MPPPPGSYVDLIRHRRHGLKVALVTAHPWGRNVDPECIQAAQVTAALCEDLGHKVVEVTLQLPADDLIEAMMDVWSASVAEEVGDLESDLDLVEGLTRSWALRGRSLPASRLVRALDTFAIVTRKALRSFGDADIILTPTLPTLPPPLGIYDPRRDVPAEWYFESPIGNLEAFTSLFNVTGQPAISLPLAQAASGLPIGVQIAGRPYREDTLLQVAAQLEEAAPWASRMPPSHASLA